MIMVLILVCYLSFSALAFDLVITPTVGALLIVGTMLVAYGIAAQDGASFEECCVAAYQNAETNVRNIIDGINDLFDGNPAGQTVELEKEQLQPIKDWVTDICPSADTTQISTSTPFQFMDTTAGKVISDFEVSLSIPRTTASYTYYLIPDCQIKYDYSTTNYTMTLSLIFKDGLTISTSSSGVSPMVSNPYFNLCKPIVLPSGTMYFPFHFQSGTNDFQLKYLGSSTLYVGSKALEVSGGRVRYHNGTAYVYLSPAGETQTSVITWLGNVILSKSSIAVSVDADAYTGLTTMPLDGTKKVSITIPQDLPSASVANPADVVTMSNATAVPDSFPDTNIDNDTAQKFKIPAEVLPNKFPFCIPFDIMRAFETLRAPAVVPHWEIPFNIPSVGISETIVIDFGQFSKIASIVRWFLSMIFVLGLMLVTRKLIM